MDLGLEKAGMQCVGQVEIMPFALQVLSKRFPKTPKHTNVSTLLRSGFPAKTFHSQEIEKDLQEKGQVYSLKQRESLKYLSQNGFLSRMFPDSYRRTKDGTWQLSCSRWPKAAMGGLTEYWTVDISESPNAAVECSLSDVLEANVHPKFYLSRKAIEGIIRRTKKWNRSGYVFLRETENGKTQPLRLLSLHALSRLITEACPSDNSETKTTLSQEQCQPILGEAQEKQPTKLLLRRLTPTEKERLQGFPTGFTYLGE